MGLTPDLPGLAPSDSAAPESPAPVSPATATAALAAGDSRGRAAGRLAAAAALLFWFFLFLAFFWRTNTPLWHQGAGAPLGVFSHLAWPEAVSLRQCPPLDLLAGAAAIALYWLVGWLFLRGGDFFLTRIEETALATLFGAGFCGAAFELLAMAGALRRGPVLLALAALAAGLAWRALRRARAPLEAWDPAAARDLAHRLAAERGIPEEGGGSGAINPLALREAHVEREEGETPLRAAIPLFAGPLAPPRRRALRRAWRAAFARGLDPVGQSLTGRFLGPAAAALTGVITLLTFFHALFYPETYWDSLILYLGYGRMTWLEGGFPFKASAQVGIGLGANYPHLFSTHAAAVAAVLGRWSDVPARLWAPAAALGATALLYAAALRLWRNRLIAILVTLLFRALPYGIAYSTYASDYALALFFGAAALWFAVAYLRAPSPSLLLASALLPALAMRLNYLMGVLWAPWLAAVLLAHWRRAPAPLDRALAAPAGRLEWLETEVKLDAAPSGEAAVFAAPWRVPSPGALARSRRAWVCLALAIAIGSPWYLRNWLLTGNPVYAFFPGIFGGARINREVLRSAEGEWFRNGDGIGRLAATLPRWERLPGAEPPTANNDLDNAINITLEDGSNPGAAKSEETAEPEDIARRGPLARLRASWMFWAGFETFYYPGEGGRLKRGRWRDRIAYLLFDWSVPAAERLLDMPADSLARPGDSPPRPLPGYAVKFWPHAYKLAPTALGLALPGALFWLALWIAGAAAARRAGASPERDEALWSGVVAPGRAGLALAIYSAVFLAYQYCIADLYLYQILPVILAIALFPGWALAALWRWGEVGRGRRAARALFAALCGLILLTGLVPGVAMALMGFKFSGARVYDGIPYSQLNLAILRRPGMPTRDFYAIQFGEETAAWDYINKNLRGERLLTHENRHYLFDPSITLVHLDDWAMQPLYGMKSDRERMAHLRRYGIRYYYYTPNEDNHAINRRAGLWRWRGGPFLREIGRWGGTALYEIRWSAAGLPEAPPARLAPIEDYQPAGIFARRGDSQSATNGNEND